MLSLATIKPFHAINATINDEDYKQRQQHSRKQRENDTEQRLLGANAAGLGNKHANNNNNLPYNMFGATARRSGNNWCKLMLNRTSLSKSNNTSSNKHQGNNLQIKRDKKNCNNNENDNAINHHNNSNNHNEKNKYNNFVANVNNEATPRARTVEILRISATTLTSKLAQTLMTTTATTATSLTMIKLSTDNAANYSISGKQKRVENSAHQYQATSALRDLTQTFAYAAPSFAHATHSACAAPRNNDISATTKLHCSRSSSRNTSGALSVLTTLICYTMLTATAVLATSIDSVDTNEIGNAGADGANELVLALNSNNSNLHTNIGRNMSTNNSITTTLLDFKNLLNAESSSLAGTAVPAATAAATAITSSISVLTDSVTTANAGDINFNVSNDMNGQLEQQEEIENTSEYVFDRTDVRIIFITLYTMVFCCCFFGNLLVILVVTMSRRLRSITNFFLANLALADFCVGLFCVMQNLSIYLIDSWVFGEFLCRMYQFVHSLSYTASIFILVVICMERYFAIVHPITCKQILTAARLRMVILTVWITSALYSTPKFVFSKTIKNIHNDDGQEEEICVLDRKMFNSKLLDMINFVLLYVIPLLVMTVLYSKIAIALWRSSRGLTPHVAQHHHQQAAPDSGMGLHNSMYQHHSSHSHHPSHPHSHHSHGLVAAAHNHHHQLSQQQLQPLSGAQHQQQTQPPDTPISGSSMGGMSLSRKQNSKYEKRGVSITESQLDNSCKVSLDADRPVVTACRKTSFYHHSHSHSRHGFGNSRTSGGGSGAGYSAGAAHMSHSTNNVLRARRGVVRMLIIFVLTFALCNLPYHARKMWQYWSRSYRGDSNFNALLTPLTFLVTYFNSGVNPLLYAFLSRNFRKGMKELLLCSWKKGKSKSSSNSSMHHKRKALQTHSLPTDTTHIGNEQL